MRLRSYFLLSIIALFLSSLSESFLYKNLSEFHLNGQFKNFSYLSPEGLWGGEEIDGRIKFEFKKEETLGINAELSFQKGYFLYDKWYFNWEETPLTFRINGSTSNNTFFLKKGDINLAQDIKLFIQGKTDLEKKSFYLNRAILNIENADKAYYLLLKQPLQTIYPVIKKTGINGKLCLEAKEFSFPDLDGQIWASFEGDVSLPYLKLDGLNFLLPVFHHSPEEKTGFVQISRVLFKHDEIKNIDLPLLIKANQIHLTEAIQLPITEGLVSINRLIGTISPFSLRGDVSIENISPQFLPFLSNLCSEKLSFELTPKILKIYGRILISIWDGEVMVENVEVDHLFSPYPKIRADIVFRDIDLAQISQQFPFGEISGIINGYIKNLVIAYGQPEEFDLLIESVKQKGRRQMISLAAVNNISILAQGSPVMVSWLFPKKFPYQKIGIKCSLRNDYFVIHGLIKKGNMEYLVKRRLFGIDVVNRSPGQMVAFKEMVDRFKQINRRD